MGATKSFMGNGHDPFCKLLNHLVSQRITLATSSLHSSSLALDLDLLKSIKLSASSPWAGVTRFLPGFLSLQIGGPKWPCPTLNRTGGICQTCASVGIQQNTVTVRIFFQTPAISHSPHALILKFLKGHFHYLGEISNFFRIDPYKAWATRTTFSTLRTTEFQS